MLVAQTFDGAQRSRWLHVLSTQVATYSGEVTCGSQNAHLRLLTLLAGGGMADCLGPLFASVRDLTARNVCLTIPSSKRSACKRSRNFQDEQVGNQGIWLL